MSRRSTPRTAAERRVSSAISGIARFYQLRRRSTVCRYGLTVSECYGLEAVADAEGLTVMELAAALGLDKSSTSRIAGHLRRSGLVSVALVPGNLKSKRVTATARGRAMTE